MYDIHIKYAIIVHSYSKHGHLIGKIASTMRSGALSRMYDYCYFRTFGRIAILQMPESILSFALVTSGAGSLRLCQQLLLFGLYFLRPPSIPELCHAIPSPSAAHVLRISRVIP